MLTHLLHTRSLHAQISSEVRVRQLLEQLSPQSLPKNLTWIQGGSSWWQQAEVHLAQVNSIVEGRKEHPPDGHDSAHQHVDGEKKKSGYTEHAPGGREEKG